MTDHDRLGADLMLIRLLRAEMRRAPGRVYRIDLEALDLQSLRALLRLLQDLEAEKANTVRRAAIEPWRRW